MSSNGERFTESVREYLIEYKLTNSAGEPSLGKLSARMLGELYDRFEQAEIRRGRAERTKKLSKGDRDKIFTALAVGTGCDPAVMTEPEVKRCVIAASGIIRAVPDVKPEEITAACERYRREFSGVTITPHAVMNQWSKLFDMKNRGAATRREPDKLEEPDDWRGLMRDDEDDARWVEIVWERIPPYYQTRIAKKCARARAGKE